MHLTVTNKRKSAGKLRGADVSVQAHSLQMHNKEKPHQRNDDHRLSKLRAAGEKDEGLHSLSDRPDREREGVMDRTGRIIICSAHRRH